MKHQDKRFFATMKEYLPKRKYIELKNWLRLNRLDYTLIDIALNHLQDEDGAQYLDSIKKRVRFLKEQTYL